MSRLYFIDGYNVIHHCPTLGALARRDFEAAREALFDLVSRYCACSGSRALLVFDGRGRHREPASSSGQVSGAEVVYSPVHQSADALIERMVYNARTQPGDRIVVSGDRAVRELCRMLGAIVIGPGNFLGLMHDVQGRIRRDCQALVNRPARYTIEDRLSEKSMRRLTAIRHGLDHTQ